MLMIGSKEWLRQWLNIRNSAMKDIFDEELYALIRNSYNTAPSG